MREWGEWGKVGGEWCESGTRAWGERGGRVMGEREESGVR